MGNIVRKFGNIDYIHIYDNITQGMEYREGIIEIFPTKNGEMQYTAHKEVNAKIIKNALMLENYSGKLYIPQSIGLVIGATYRNISGVLSSPTIITGGNGDISIKIDPQSNMELSLEAEGVVRLNNKIVYYGADIDEQNAFYTIGRSFSGLKRRHLNNICKNSLNPKIIEHEDYISANLKDSILTCYDIDVCLRYNIVYVNKALGNINLYYDEPVFNTPKEFRLYTKKTECVKLERRLEKAKNNNDYNSAIKIKTKIDDVKKEITKLTNPQQSF